MNNFAITAADAVSRRYKSNDPEAIIAQRAIKIKDIRFCEELLGFYTVLLNCEYIGINPNCSKQQRRSALAHELGHAIFDRKHAASGQAFQRYPPTLILQAICSRHRSPGRMDVPSQSKPCVISAPPGLPITVTLVTVLLCSSRGKRSICSLSTLIHASTVG